MQGAPDNAYIRGSGGVHVNARKVGAIVVALCLAAMLAVAAEMFVSAARHNDQISRLQRHGVPVQATVTRCLGISSGIAFGIEYWQCSGSYTLAGHTYEEVIGGSGTHLRDGQTVVAVADPGRPNVVWTEEAVASLRPSNTAYITPSVLTGIVVVVLAGWGLIRTRSKTSKTTESSVGDGPGVGLAQPGGHMDEQLVGERRDLVEHGQKVALADKQ